MAICYFVFIPRTNVKKANTNMKGVVFLMKKFLVFITVLALIAFAGCAFATSGGHINPAADVNTDPVVDYEPTSADVTATGATVTLVDYNLDTPDGFDAADIYLPTETANKVAVMTNVRINVTDHTPGSPVTISFANYNDTRTTDLYAFIKANLTASGYTADKFYDFECTVSNHVLSFTVDKPEVFFSENTVVLATAKTVSSSGGGCNAGYAGLLLLAAVPFFFRKK
ncbi:MAG: SYNERG-CTERM sorting domain-containing protein [Verrucomicrobiae bacterium]|nr:SYNERG-CTERM sorting domain-containing protein [Verrucomicrobiae bacterium]